MPTDQQLSLGLVPPDPLGRLTQQRFRDLERLVQELIDADVWSSKGDARAYARSLFGPSIKSSLDLTEQMAVTMMNRMRALLREKRERDRETALAKQQSISAGDINWGNGA